MQMGDLSYVLNTLSWRGRGY